MGFQERRITSSPASAGLINEAQIWSRCHQCRGRTPPSWVIESSGVAALVGDSVWLGRIDAARRDLVEGIPAEMAVVCESRTH